MSITRDKSQPHFSEQDSIFGSSIPKSALTDSSSEARGGKPDRSSVHNDFLSLLAVAQRLRVDFLPITWHTGLTAIGKGGTADINQSPVNLQTSFAFKRVRKESYQLEDEKERFSKTIIELEVHGHPLLRDNPNIAKLEGIGWEFASVKEAWPVLVSEKAHLGDLDMFTASTEGENLSFGDRIGLCADIATALTVMHANSECF